MDKSSHTSTHSHRVDKIGGTSKEWLKRCTSRGRAVLKKSANAKRRRYLKLEVSIHKEKVTQKETS